MKRIIFSAIAILCLGFPGLARAADIVETAANADGFKTLVAAVKAAGLVETLQGSGPFTVLAPTDEAFAKLPEGTLESLLKPENKGKLREILTYHVIPAQVPASTVVTLSDAKTVQGSPISIRSEGQQVKINEATVVKTDIACDNGLIHVIDSVLLPPEKSAASGCHSKACSQLAEVVAKGAPMYNAGHHAACADLYRNTLTEMMSLDLSQELKGHVAEVLATAEHQHDATTRAWTLRRGIDRMYTTLQRMN